ncbi:hypothetical protein [Saccharomonospora xinjiangensis]|nr:hypothetical protein [Saccharomonospora xinjiangensis]
MGSGWATLGTITLPLVMRVGDELYLVAMLSGNVNWVRSASCAGRGLP